MPELTERLRGRIDEDVNTDVLNKQLGIETLFRHARSNKALNKTLGNEDGTTSSVRSGSVEDGNLNGGRPTLIPFIYDGKLVGVKEAIERAVQSGKTFPAFDTNDEATITSRQISDRLGKEGS